MADVQARLAALEADGCEVHLSAGTLGERTITASGEGMAVCSIRRHGQTASAKAMTRDEAAARAIERWEYISG